MSAGFGVRVTSIGPNRLAVISRVRSLTQRAPALVKSEFDSGRPVEVVTDVGHCEAESIAGEFRSLGAEVEIYVSSPCPSECHRPSTEAEFVADLVDASVPLDRYFLVAVTADKHLISCWHEMGRPLVCIVEDDTVAAAHEQFLRVRGYPVFDAMDDVYAHAARMRWPGWDRPH